MDILINLLPEGRKNDAKNLRYVGVVLRIGVTALFALAALAAFSYACLYFIKTEEKATESDFAIFVQTDVYKKTKSAQESLREYNKIASRVKRGFEKQEKYWDLIMEVNSLVPSGVVLDYFGVSDEGDMSLRGTARTRSDLLVFKEKIEGSEFFEKLEFPISNFVTEKEAKFEFKAKIK